MRLTPTSVAALLMLGASQAAAAPQLYRVGGLPRGGALAIRESPDAAATTITEIPVGRRVTAFGCTADTPSGNTWCRVKFGRDVGWARRRYLAPEGRANDDDAD